MRLIRCAVLLGVVVLLMAGPAGAKGEVAVTPESGPPGTVVTLTGSLDWCTSPVRVTFQPIYRSDWEDPDWEGGEPFEPPDGTATVPLGAAPGESQIAIVCDHKLMDAAWFNVEPIAVRAQPNLTGYSSSDFSTSSSGSTWRMPSISSSGAENW
jgi:hypothetical protein